MCRVLHVTDFHLIDPDGETEHLRRRFYQEYLYRLVEALRLAGAPVPGCIVATGDFVDRGRIENFGHATAVLTYLADLLQIGPERVAVCIGNQDLVKSFETSRKYDEARKEFVEFAGKFANGSAVKAMHPWGGLLSVGPGVSCLIMDSTRGNTPLAPGELPQPVIDEIAGLWVHDLPEQDLLVVANHFLPFTPENLLFDYNEGNPTWHESHVWVAGKPLQDRICKWREQHGQPTLWLCGDIHQPLHQVVQPQQYVVTTGRLGTPTPGADSAIKRQARLIEVSRSRGEATVWTCNFEPAGHHENPNLGTWKVECSNLRYGGAGPAVAAPAPATLVPTVTATSVVPAAGVPHPLSTICAIDSQIEERVLQAVREKDLYSIGRFHTGEKEVSLAWVSVGPLLNEPGLLRGVISCMSRWFSKKLTEFGLKPNEVVILGIDCWGAVLASQLSVLSGSTNFCLAARGRGEHNIGHETVSQSVCEALTHSKAVLAVSDVIATGNTLRWVYDEVVAKAGAEVATSLRWLSFSVICDPAQHRTADCLFLSDQATVCAGLRMPILSREAIPDETTFPATLSFGSET